MALVRSVVTACGLASATLCTVILFNINQFDVDHIHSNIYKPFKKVFDSRHGSLVQSKLSFKVSGVSCEMLFEGKSTQSAKSWSKSPKSLTYSLHMEKFVKASRSMLDYCNALKEIRRYITEPLTKEEEDFPISYSIGVNTDVELFERLLRAIYRPQHYYCIHVDQSAEEIVHDAVRAIVKCFTNVFIPAKIIDVVHSEFSVLEVELLCMRELLAYKKWKYFINLTGQEFPLQTSISIAKILKAFNGANSIEGTIKRPNLSRFKENDLAPGNVTVTKGQMHIVASRSFVEYAILNETAIELLEWVKGTHVADETYFSTLNHNPQLGVPGLYKREPETFTTDYPYIARFKSWPAGSPNSWPCAGKRVRGICIFGVGDLPLLATRPELFANKFHKDYEPLAYACMEELINNRTRDELSGARVFNTSYYEQLSFVRNHV